MPKLIQLNVCWLLVCVRGLKMKRTIFPGGTDATHLREVSVYQCC